MGYNPKYSEAFYAAKWWVTQLRTGAELDMGDDYQSMIATLMSRNHKISPAILDQYEEALSYSIVEYLENHQWDSQDPNAGADDRRIMCDLTPPAVLSDPWQKVTGSPPPHLYFPVKTIMWINPGSIVVKHGYRATEKEVWNKDAAADSLR